MIVLINYLYSHCQDDPVFKAVCNHLHGAIRESRQTASVASASAQAASVAIAAQRRMILDASAFRDCRPLRAILLSTPFVGSSLFGGQFQSSVEKAMRSQEKLTQVRQLASAGSRAAQGTSGSRVPPQSQKRRAVPPPPPPSTTQLVPSGDGGSAAKRRRSQNRGNNRRSGGAPTQSQAQHGARGSPARGLRPAALDGSTPSPPLSPPISFFFFLGGGWVDLSGHSWLGVGYTAWNCAERSFPCGRQTVIFLPSLATNNLRQVCPGGYQTGVLPRFCEASPFVFVSCGDTVAQAAVQMTGAVGRGFIPPIQEGRGDCRFVTGPGGILFPLFPGHQAHWWVPPHPQPTRPQLIYLSCQVPHGDPLFHSSGSSQRLVDGVAGSPGRLSACDDTPQSLAVPSVCSQGHCLPMEGSPFWLSHCPQSFYQTPGFISSSPAFAGMSDVPVHRRPLSCTGISKPDSAHPRHQSLLSLQAGFYHKPHKVGPCPVSGNAPLESSDRHSQGIGFSIPTSDRSNNSCNSIIVRPKPKSLLYR